MHFPAVGREDRVSQVHSFDSRTGSRCGSKLGIGGSRTECVEEIKKM